MDKYHAFARRIWANDPRAKVALKKILARANRPGVGQRLHVLAQALRDEKPSMISGAIPQVASVVGKVTKLVLSPVAWTAGQAGHLAHWSGAQLQHLSHAL